MYNFCGVEIIGLCLVEGIALKMYSCSHDNMEHASVIKLLALLVHVLGNTTGELARKQKKQSHLFCVKVCSVFWPRLHIVRASWIKSAIIILH